MAGGVGSRFWPGSREARPKQLDMLGVGKSLLRLTFERFLPLCPASNIFIVTNAAYKDLIKAQIPEITDNQILCEPSRNNTAPCVAYTAFKLAALDPEANFIIAPSDHIVLKEQAFLRKFRWRSILPPPTTRWLPWASSLRGPTPATVTYKWRTRCPAGFLK